MGAEDAKRHGFIDNGNARPGLFFGRAGSGLLKYSGDGNTLLVAPPGAGKGVGFVLPNLLTYPGSVVCIDPKGENAMLTSEARRRMGQSVFVLDPAGITGIPSDQYNPLFWLKKSGESRFDADVRNLAECLVPGDGMDGFWARGGRVVAAALIYWLLSQPDTDRSLKGLYDLAFTSENEWFGLWRGMRSAQSGSPDLLRRVRDLGNWFDGLEEKHKLYHRGTLQDGLQWLSSDGAQRVVSSSSFDMRQLKGEKITVFLCIPPDELTTYKPLARLIVSQAVQGVFARLARPSEIPVVFMLDEFANSVGQMTVLDAAYSQIRGYGGRLAIVVQTMSQLKDLYPVGQNRPVSWETIEETSGAEIFFKARRGTAEHVSKMLGTVRRPRFQPIGGPREVEEPLLTPQQVSNPPGGYGQESVFAFIEGLEPIWCQKIVSYSDEEFLKLHDPNKFKPKVLPGSVSWWDEGLRPHAVSENRPAPEHSPEDEFKLTKAENVVELWD